MLVVKNDQNFYSDNFWTLRPPHQSEISLTKTFCLFLAVGYLPHFCLYKNLLVIAGDVFANKKKLKSGILSTLSEKE